MEHKVGERVKIKSLDWCNKNKDIHGNIECGDALMNIEKSQFCGKIVTISSISDVTDTYKIEEDNGQYIWTDEMIEGLVEEEIREVTDKHYWEMVGGENNNEINLPKGNIFKDENGNVINATKIVLEKKKKEYPKTYEECCKIMQVARPIIWFDYDDVSSISEEGDEYESHIENTLCAFRKLLICRDAYWKLAGEEMGLGEPWEPDWTDDNAKYSIYTIKGALTKAISCYDGAILTFPTEEMRDAFYENFKELIEQCKELL